MFVGICAAKIKFLTQWIYSLNLGYNYLSMVGDVSSWLTWCIWLLASWRVDNVTSFSDALPSEPSIHAVEFEKVDALHRAVLDVLARKLLGAVAADGATWPRRAPQETLLASASPRRCSCPAAKMSICCRSLTLPHAASQELEEVLLVVVLHGARTT